MTRKPFLYLFLSLCIARPLYSGDTSTRGPLILQVESGARPLGLGGAYAAVSDDAGALNWNPAGLQQLKRQEVQLMRSELMSGRTQDDLIYARPSWRAGDRETWGLAVHHLTMDPFTLIEDDQSQGSVHPQDFVVGLSRAGSLFGSSWGMTLKWVETQTYEQNGHTFAVDGGVLGHLSKAWTWGLSVANLGPSMALGDDKVPLPTIFRSGLARRWGLGSADWLATGDIDYPLDGDGSGRVGIEYGALLGPHWRAALRAGVRSSADGRLSFGGGITRDGLGLNYAFTSFGDQGSASRMDLTFKFGGELKPEVRREELLTRGQDLLDRGELIKARTVADELLVLSPRHPPSLVLDKEVRLRFSESLDPKNLLILGQKALAAQDYPEAIHRFRKLLAVDPTNTEGKAGLARAESLLEKSRQAQISEEVQRARAQQRNRWEREASSRFARNQWEAAIALWQKWMDVGGDPQRGNAEIRRCQERLYSEAEKSLASGAPEKAMAQFKTIGPGYRDAEERSIRISRDLENQRIARGKVKYEDGMRAYAAGDVKKAQTLFEEALANNPSDQRVIQALNRLREQRRPTPTRPGTSR